MTPHCLQGPASAIVERTVNTKRRCATNPPMRRLPALVGVAFFLVAPLVVVVPGCSGPGPRAADQDGAVPDGSSSCANAVTLRYSGPGPDGVWGTADDVIVQRDDYGYDALGQNVLLDWFTGAGPDGTWGTADDVETHRYHSIFQGGHQIARAEFGGPGPDNVWGTSDDRQLSNSVFAYDSAGRMASETNTNLGSDGVWGTADDQIGLRIVFGYDASGRLSTLVLYDGPGLDGVWATADDTVRSSFSITTDAAGNYQTVFENDAPGPDRIWGTHDDVPVTLFRFTCGDPTESTETVSLSPGPDGLWNTADDPIDSELRTSHQGTCGPNVCAPALY